VALPDAVTCAGLDYSGVTIPEGAREEGAVRATQRNVRMGRSSACLSASKARPAIFILLAALAGCDGGGPQRGGDPFTDAEWKVLRGLAPDTLPPAAEDVSNRYGDDATAAALGEQLFFEAGFSGPLLDLDNDGSPRSLGLRGASGKVSCAGCHDEDAGFLDNRSPFKELSLGTGWTARRTPSLLDVGQATIVMWGGRRSTLYSQFFGPIENPLEMNSSRLFVAQWIAAHYKKEYEAVFGAGTLDGLDDDGRFPTLSPETTGCRLTEVVDHPQAEPPDPLYECHGMPGDGAEYDSMAKEDQELVTAVIVNAGKAVAAYERLVVCGPGRFDAWVHGDEGALTAEEQRGLKLFVGKAKCLDCHAGPHFSDQRFYNVGLAEKPTQIGIDNTHDRGAMVDLVAAAADPVGISSPYSDGDDGRMPEKVGPEYEGAFRTPTLRCASKRPTFMHSGLLHSLEEVVAFFNRGGDAPGTYMGEGVLTPLGLTKQEEADLVAFLRALAGDAPVPTFR
jgi:cytochrome c peroxidase